MKIISLYASFINLPSRKKFIVRAYQFVIMHRVHNRDFEISAHIQNRRREVVVDIVDMHNVGTLLEDKFFKFLFCFKRIQYPKKCFYFFSNTLQIIKIDVRYKKF